MESASSDALFLTSNSILIHMKYPAAFVIILVSHLPSFSQQPGVYAQLEKQYNTENYDACVQMTKQVEAFTKNRLDTLVANSFFYLADAYNQTGDLKKALHYFELEKQTLQALRLSRTTHFSNSLNNLAYLYLQDGNYRKAGAIADELLANDRLLFGPTDQEYVTSVLDVADIYIQLDRIKDAEALLGGTLRQQPKNTINRGLLLNKIGDLYSYNGQYSRALRSLMEALDVHGELVGEESPEYINAAINLGILFMNQGKYPEAEEIFEVALTKVAPTEIAYASLLNNQALVFQNLGQLERAEQTLNQIKKRDSVDLGPAHPDYAITLSNLGLVYADRGKFEDAQSALTTALAIQKQNGESTTISYARKLNNLAKVYQMKGSPQQAVPLLEEALAIFKKNIGKESPEFATSAYNLGVALWKAGNGDAAYKYLRLSATIRAKRLGKNHPRYAESILKIAEYQWEKRLAKEARTSFGEVFDNYYFQIDETFPVLTEEEKSKFYYTNIRPAFDKFNSFAFEAMNQNPQLVNDVYNYVINTKASIMYATEKVRKSILASGDKTLIDQFEQWQSAREQIAKLYSQNQEHHYLDSLLKSADVIEKELARRSASFSRQLVRGKVQVDDIRKALRPGEAAVEVLRFKKYNPKNAGAFEDKANYAFLVVTADPNVPVRLIPMPMADEMETKFLRYYRNNIKYNLSDAGSYEHYFRPLGEYLRKQNVSRLFFSPDGVYNQINLNGIENPQTKKFLIDEFDIRMVTNTRELLEVTQAQEDPQPSALMGYPKYNLGASEITASARESGSRGLGNRAWRGGLLRYMRGEEGISALPGTQAEIEKIADLFGESTSVYMEQQASEQIAKSVNNPRVLHIATHGYFLEDQTGDAGSSTAYFSSPLLNAGLILAGAENFLRTGQPVNEEGDDGILTAFEAMNLKLDNTQLVVLSACETALGDVRNGEGVYGLQRALKLAGARSIVMSLWNVDDDATQELMTAFYEEMFKSEDQHEAFRIAQQKVKEKYPSPYYWASFVMVGI